MDNLYELLFPSDWLRLPKEILSEIPNSEPWIDPPAKDALSEEVIKKILQVAFAGRGSVSWYFLNESSIDKVHETTRDYEEYRSPERRPSIVKAAVDSEGRHVWRIEVDKGIRLNPQGIEVTMVQSIGLITVILDVVNKYVEVRAGYTTRKPVVDFLTKVLKISLVEATNFSEYSGQLDDLANILGASVVGAYSTIVLDEELDQNVYDMMAKVIEALDATILSDDPGMGDLENAIADYQNKIISRVPITEVLLSGLEALGMGVNKLRETSDLRVQPLYKLLRPFIQHAHGHLRLYHDDVKHTIRVGFKTNTLEFMTPATEKFIAFVRKALMGSSTNDALIRHGRQSI
jgi:hypothetical protein